MIIPKRYINNPILSPSNNYWEMESSFNGCPVIDNRKTYLLYRALSKQIYYKGVELKLSTIGIADSKDGFNFLNRRQLIVPEYDWEKFGCEDPRVIKIDDKFYIFYTALSDYPFTPQGIKVALAISKDLKTIEKKNLIVPFNSKAMSLFPERINGKLWSILTVDTDRPPSRMCVAEFENEEEMYDKNYWSEWKCDINKNVLNLQRSINDQVEVGAPPIKTKKGWLVIYSYIHNYFSSDRLFGVEAVLLDLKNPRKILGRSSASLINPEEDYELKGEVSNVVFPSGVTIIGNDLNLYYGGADTNCCVATFNLKKVLDDVLKVKTDKVKFVRTPGGPVLEPIKNNNWESLAVFNPAAIKLDNKVHILYRAMSLDNTSTIGYAVSSDGVNIDEKLDKPIYVPREDFESKKNPGGNSGCEDPRLTKIGNKIYMLYTAFNGVEPPAIAMTFIEEKDFLNREWNWESPKIVSIGGVDDKDACILSEKINGKYTVFHRIGNTIDISFVDDLANISQNSLISSNLLKPRKGRWDGQKVGISSPPIKTKDGWLMIYHGVSEKDNIYRIGAVLLDLKNPRIIKSRIDYPIFEPVTQYEKVGIVPNVVFPCGSVVLKNNLYIYYGGADKVIGIAVVSLSKLLNEF